MPISYGLFSIPGAVGWSIGPLDIRGGDIYAIVGMFVVLALLSLWVIIEKLRQTREGFNQTEASHVSEPDASAVDRPNIPFKAPVPARAEWLLDDNTLVRTQAVRRGPLRPPAQPQPTDVPPTDMPTDTSRQAPPIASDMGEAPPATQ